MQDRLFEDPEIVQFYDAENGSRDDIRYCLAMAQRARSVLDLGCGTGLLAAALGGSHDTFGVDPAGAMLDVARNREGGSLVTWVEADARKVRLGRRFELVLLTGHAFQCFLTDDDQRTLCQTIAAHLEPHGTFIFDSRNPHREEWRDWTPETSFRSFELQPHGTIEAWNDVNHEPATGIVNYDNFYRTRTNHIWKASSRIRFASKQDIASRLAEAGLKAVAWLGDWQGHPWTPMSAEIIPIGQHL